MWICRVDTFLQFSAVKRKIQKLVGRTSKMLLSIYTFFANSLLCVFPVPRENFITVRILFNAGGQGKLECNSLPVTFQTLNLVFMQPILMITIKSNDV